MADITQEPGELNISKIYKGDDVSWTITIPGDVTLDTFYAAIDNGTLADVIPTIAKSYSGVTLKTTVTFSLTSVQTALLVQSVLGWYCTWTASSTTRTFLKGTIGVYIR